MTSQPSSSLYVNILDVTLQLDKPAVVELETIAQVQPPAKVTQPDVGNDAVTVRSLIILFLKSVFEHI